MTERVGQWGHIICGLQIPELWFHNLATMSKICGFEYVQGRKALTCRICKRRVGYCIQCWSVGQRRHAAAARE